MFLTRQHLPGRLGCQEDLVGREVQRGMVYMVAESLARMVAAGACQAFQAYPVHQACLACRVYRLNRAGLEVQAGNNRCIACPVWG